MLGGVDPTDDSSRTRPVRYIPALDGLRAVAVGAVLVFHADSPLAPGGFLGVSLFFTLSGFLITSLLLAEHEQSGTVALRRFYLRRARRLLPAAYACLAMVLLLAGYWALEARRDLAGDVVAALANVANWRFALSTDSYSDLFAGEASPVAHFWSLSIEEQLYFVLPLVLVAALRFGRRAVLGVSIVLASGSIAATLATTDPDLVYNGTHTRAAELLVGVILATLLAGRRPAALRPAVASTAGLGASALFVFLVARVELADAWLYEGGLALVGLVSGLLIVVVASGGWPAPLLAARPLVAVGKVSYGIYLFHWPVFLLLAPDRTGLNGPGLFALRCGATGVLTVISYHGLEAPIRAGRRLAAGRGAAMTGGAVAISLAAAAFVVVPVPRMSDTESLLALGADLDETGFVVFGGDSEPTVATAITEVEGSGTTRFEASPAAVEPPDAIVPTSLPKPWSTQTASDPVDDPLILVVGSDGAAVESLRANGLRVVDMSVPECPLNSSPDDDRCHVELTRWSGLAGWLGADRVVITAGVRENAVWLERAESIDTADGLRVMAELESGLLARLMGEIDSLLADRVSTTIYFPQPLGSMYDAVLGEVVARRPRLGGIARNQAELSATLAGPVLDAPVAEQPSKKAAGANIAMSDRPTRILLLGDSTSLGLARALGDVGGNRTVVAWGGANGCPIARVTAVRASSSSDWQYPDCVPFDESVPPLLDRFRPDVVLLVVGPTELVEQRFPGMEGSFLPGDAEYAEFHRSELGELRRLLNQSGVELLIADAPDIHSGPYATREMAQAWRVAELNAVFADAAATWPDVGLIGYRAAVAEMEALQGSIRRDGVHVEVAPLAELVRQTLLDEILVAAAALEQG